MDASKDHVATAALGRGPRRARFWRGGVISCPVERGSTASLLNHRSFRAQRGTCFSVLLLLLTLLLSLTACTRHPASAKRYPFKGRIVAVSSQSQSAIIDGDAIPGFMDAMAMDYKIKPASVLSQISSGDTISAEVVIVEAKGDAPPDYWLENVKVTAHSAPPAQTPKSSLHMPAPGEEVPDFAFTNESGRRISLAQYRGQVLLVTFIYTRCPFPDFCPRMSSNFAEIYKQIGTNPALATTHLLSISFDPEHDTPKVLRDYAFTVIPAHDAALFNRWEFAVPSTTDLPRVADFFALTIKSEGGLITHNLSTAVIGPDGKIVSWYHGGDWQVSDLIRDATGAAPQKHA